MPGIYVGFQNRDRFFSEDLENEVEFEINVRICTVQFAPSFWTTCPEIRVARDKFGRNYLFEWIKKNNLMPPSLSRQRRGIEDKVILEVIEPCKKFKLYIYK